MAAKGKSYPSKNYPVNANEVSDLFQRVEPMLTPEKLISRYLKKVDLTDYTPDELKDRIMLAMNEVEILTGLILSKTQFRERIPYDASLYRNFIHIKAQKGPIISVEELTVKSSNNETIYKIPLEWIEMGNSKNFRQVNVMPILSVFGTSGNITQSAPNGGLIFLQSTMNYRWTPAFWEMLYTAGVCGEDGKVPVMINELIGMTATIALLSDLQTQYIYSSQSLSQDGISQSAGVAGGGQPWATRIQLLREQRDALVALIKKTFNNRINVSNI